MQRTQRTWKKLVVVALLILTVMGLVVPLVAATTSWHLDSPTGDHAYIADPEDTFGTGGGGGGDPEPPNPEPLPPPQT
ncbi:hypothetical protein CEE36_03635 [candidate division TA06 bacterium B3_TA06]|uniref:Uncharacterized protein n=1 Tax=candidate division TA06 bacterium B3_TA06 TaxID=2012487 RepID=A0A532V8X9_UNCT6|nr:MAG: hypothetical protein CEE36_03635 [candidate division TA06 bacterium B3_TA06]